MVLQNAQSTSVVEFVGDEKTNPENDVNCLFQWRAMLAELISTTLLLFLGCMSCIPAHNATIHPPMYSPISFALVVLLNISSFGHISGAHMNPSVTLSAVLFGTISISLGALYVVAQIAGAVAGYGLLVAVTPIDLVPDSICVTQPHPAHEPYQSLIIEVILSMALAFINCAVWDPANADKNDAIPLRFGFTIAALSLAGNFLTGASMNPARSLAPALWTGNWNTHWVYWVGPIIGGAITPIFYRLILQKEKKDK